MCTAIRCGGKRSFLARTLDLEYSYNEKVTVLPKNFPLKFRHTDTLKRHYAMIGMATSVGGYPLYYDGVNEYGLSMAGLNFPISASFGRYENGKRNIAVFELIPYVLSRYMKAEEAVKDIRSLNIIGENFSENMPSAPLHFIIADKKDCYTVERTLSGLKIYDNDVGVLTNEPPFDFHRRNLSLYMNLSSEKSENRFARGIDLERFSKGMGAVGLPGDNSSTSRFVRAAFNKFSMEKGGYIESAGDVFNLMSSVFVVRGSVMENSEPALTLYTAVMDLDESIYYFSTENCRQISSVSLKNEDLDKSEIIEYSLSKKESIRKLN